MALYECRSDRHRRPQGNNWRDRCDLSICAASLQALCHMRYRIPATGSASLGCNSVVHKAAINRVWCKLATHVTSCNCRSDGRHRLDWNCRPHGCGLHCIVHGNPEMYLTEPVPCMLHFLMGLPCEARMPSEYISQALLAAGQTGGTGLRGTAGLTGVVFVALCHGNPKIYLTRPTSFVS